ncbi:hypothetical protein ABT256_21860 [Amycolatopsis japonica]|uniref:hypothetical protein n=1 Tax=Amycolatopsis japonica TaxID=208439 RepID=UPI00331F8E9D
MAAKAEVLDEWTLAALRSLFQPLIVLGHGDDGSLSLNNGIHRAQAMRDAKVAITITAERELVTMPDS